MFDFIDDINNSYRFDVSDWQNWKYQKRTKTADTLT